MQEIIEQILTFFPSKGEQLIILLGGAAGAVWHFVFGHITPQLSALIFLMCLDYAMGVFAAVKNRELSSSKAGNGFVKKCLILCVVALGHQVDVACATDIVSPILLTGYSINECLSIIELICRAGYASVVPPQLYAVLEVLKDRGAKR